MPLVYAFDHAHRRPPKDLAHLLGGKGANLAEMTSVLRLPVPPGFTITTAACTSYLSDGWPERLDAELDRAVRRLEAKTGRRLGDPDDPLLVSVRSGAARSMPGMMDTVLNLGLNDASVRGLAAQTDARFAYDAYRRFLALYGRVVLGVEAARFDELLDAAKALAGVDHDAAVDPVTLEHLCARYHAVVEEEAGGPFPHDPADQLRGAVAAVFRSWHGDRAVAYRRREGIPDDLGTAVNVQAMVFGNRDDRSGTGVGFTRDAATGERRVYGDYLVNAQGEDVVAGTHATSGLEVLADAFPKVHAELLRIFRRLERHYRDMCDTEFTIEQGKLWMLQTRIGKRSGAAAVRMAVEMTQQRGWRISRAEAINRVTADHLDQLLHPHFAAAQAIVLTTGLGASPGAAVGGAYFTADAAMAAADRGEPVVLVRNETSPDDVAGMQVSNGILTARGGLVSHAAVVARGWGIPAVVGAEAVHLHADHFTVGDTAVREGEVISIDGATGEVVLGAVDLEVGEPPEALETLLAWADDVRSGTMGVRANADTAADAATARSFGAEGIGLCRTEHMFLAEDRLPIVRSMLLAASPEEEVAALERLRRAQRDDFAGILTAMDGLPVTVRLLDPPLHEFLPSVEELTVREALGTLDAEGEALLAMARDWREENPMLGTRGVRLGVLKPGLYAMQVRALLEAALDLLAAGAQPIVEIMVPLTVNARELRAARGWIDQAVAEVRDAGKSEVPVDRLRLAVGTMIETPRAALVAAELAREVDFFSFGTNDLTQMTFGFSRDDVEHRMMPAYLDQGLLPADPFETLDGAGVGALVRQATRRGRAANPSLKIGVCGEHGGDPASVALLHEAGVDYVSCSPYRVPIARLAAAQAILGAQPPRST